VNLTVAMLAGFGLAQLLEGPRWRRTPLLAVAAVIGCCVVAIATLGPTLHDIRTTIHHLRFGTDFPEAHVIALTSIAWALGLALALALVVLLRRRLGGTATAILAVALVSVDAAHFVGNYNPMPPPSRVYSFTPASIAFLQAHQGEQRVTALGFAMQPDIEMFYGLRDIRGYDPPKPTTSYFDLFRLANPAESDWGLRFPALTRQARRVLDLLSVRYLLVAPSEPPIREAEMPVVYRGLDAVVYEDRLAAPRAYVPQRVVRARGEAEVLSTLVAPGFQAGRDAVVQAPAPAASGTVRLVSAEDTRVALRADLSRGGLVVLNDAWAKGWRATVDGHPASALQVNSVGRGVIVPAGLHTIVWSYEAPGLVLGAVLSGASLLILVGLALAAVMGATRWRR
jgi:hypothetical protein